MITGILMSLNDPQWGNNKGSNQGPPDLEDLWRDFNRRLSALFGRKGGGSGDGGSRPPLNAKAFGGGIGAIDHRLPVLDPCPTYIQLVQRCVIR